MTNNLERYKKTYEYKRLLETVKDWEGVYTWLVYGEDPNCDFGGSHYQPFIGVYTGSLNDVVKEVVNLNSFWAWGAGGSIKQTTVTAV